MHPELLSLLNAQRAARPQDEVPDERTTWIAIPREMLASRGKSYDLYALGRTIEETWTIAQLGGVVAENADFIRRLWTRLKAAGTDAAVRYNTAGDVAADLEEKPLEATLRRAFSQSLTGSTQIVFDCQPVVESRSRAGCSP